MPLGVPDASFPWGWPLPLSLVPKHIEAIRTVVHLTARILQSVSKGLFTHELNLYQMS